MDQKLRRKAFAGLALLPLTVGGVLFVSAGSLNYWEGWLFLVVFSAAATLSTLKLMKNDPALLERRMRSGPTAEKSTAQRIIMSCVTVFFTAIPIVSGVDHRLAWSHLPMGAVLAGDSMIVLGFVVFDLVFRENSFASATIEISEGHKVISTGPYSLIRHPMYSGGLVFLLGIPIALGSWWALLIFIPLLPVLIWRLIDEEKFLHKNLEGYTQYCAKVKYRLIPWLY